MFFKFHLSIYYQIYDKYYITKRMNFKIEQIENLSEDLNDICEECKNKKESVTQNLIIYGFKICNSCNISKKIFPI